MTYRAYFVAALLALSPFLARADGDGVPGLPPVRPVADAPPAAAPTAGDVAELEALGSLVTAAEAQTAAARATGAAAGRQLQAPAGDLTVKPGVHEILPIALGRLNRLRTNFPKPVVRSALPDCKKSKAPNAPPPTQCVEVHDGVVYVRADVADPISLFVHQREQPDDALSLTLIPQRETTPLDLKLTLEGGTPHQVLSARPQVAAQWERDAYLDTLKRLFRALALGEVPDGYGMSAVVGPHPLMPQCWLPDVVVAPAQFLEGANLVVLVARAQNRGVHVVEIDESACAAPGVMAVASWPHVTLEPGAATEIYIALRRPETGTPRQRRPSVAGGAP